jgi:adenylosuccinate lyase
MSLALIAISPLDGRYQQQTLALSGYFSEYALFKYRLRVEIEYFIALTEIPLPQLQYFPKDKIENLKLIWKDFSINDAESIKLIEKTTNHDIKAVEYFIKQKFDELGLDEFKEFIHFGLTSQDINNTAIPLMIKEAHQEIIAPAFQSILNKLDVLADEWREIPLLARTHGQPASPSRLGKEIKVFSERLEVQFKNLEQTVWAAKFGGATGNFNAHKVAYPQINWPEFANRFVSNDLGLERSKLTTQIEHYDQLAYYFDALKRVHNILIDACRDFWTYISMDYFKQKIKEGEIGSSAMPHKVNPIDFENAEGNLGMANAILEHLSSKLPISRLQRDLTDSTVLRNVGVPLGHSLLACKSMLKGLDKLIVNEEIIATDLEKNTVVIAEAIQTILRREGVAKPYELLKELTRKNTKVNLNDIHQFIYTLPVNDNIKEELLTITPSNYTGYNF